MNDVVLVSLRDFEDDKCDVLLLYKPQEVIYLQKLGEIPSSIKTSDKIDTDETNQDLGIDFGDKNDDDDEDEKKKIEINFDTI